MHKNETSSGVFEERACMSASSEKSTLKKYARKLFPLEVKTTKLEAKNTIECNQAMKEEILVDD